MAWPPTYGMELEFTNKAMKQALADWKKVTPDHENQVYVPGPVEQAESKRLAAAIKAKCGKKCAIEEHKGKYGITEYKIVFDDGWFFNISHDPEVVEVHTKADTKANINKNTSRLQTYLFDVAKELELKTSETAHFNIGTRAAFGDSGEALLRFFADYSNHPELGMGVLGSDWANAPPIQILEPDQQLMFMEMVNRFNRGERTKFTEVATDIFEDIYTDTPEYKIGPQHYQAIGTKFVPRFDEYFDKGGEGPIEIRANWHPKTAADYALQVELMELRLDYLKNQEGPIVYRGYRPVPIELSMKEKASRFYTFVTEIGGDWEKFSKLMPTRIRNSVLKPDGSWEFDAFTSGNIDWNNSDHVKNIRKYVDEVFTSKLAREKMFQYLTSRVGANSNGAKLVIKDLMDTVRMSYSPENFTIAQDLMIRFSNDFNWKYRSELQNSVKAMERYRKLGPNRLALDSCLNRAVFKEHWSFP